MGLGLLAFGGPTALAAGPPLRPPAAATLTADPLLAAQTALARCLAPAGGYGPGRHRSCPGIDGAIYGLPLLQFLPPHWHGTLSARELAAIAALARRYAGAPPSVRPSARALRAAALRLAQPAPRHALTLWDRLKLRVARYTAPFLRLLRHWLESWAPHASGGTARRWVLGLGSLLLLALGVFIAMELRAAGLTRRGAKAGSRARLPRALPACDGEPATDEPDWPRLTRHPAALLRLLVDALRLAGRVDRDRHLTCRELAAQARFDTELQRERFTRVARLAEQEIYGPGTALEMSEELVRGAVVLRTELLAGAPRSATAPP
jgi:hypothetical protein